MTCKKTRKKCFAFKYEFSFRDTLKVCLPKELLHSICGGSFGSNLEVGIQKDLLCRVGILARFRVIDPLFFLLMHRFQLKITFMRPTGCTNIYSLRKMQNQ